LRIELKVPKVFFMKGSFMGVDTEPLSDEQLENRIREELYHGCVGQAIDWASQIQDIEKRREMLSVIREYDRC
jgi:hypothetical protein